MDSAEAQVTTQVIHRMARTASKTPSDSCPLYVMSKSSVRCKQLERIYPLVKNSYQISEEGIGARRLQQLLREGHARRLAHNQYLSTLRWQKMTPEEKHLARVIAYAKSCENPVFTHLSAAILHGIPVLKIPRTVHVRSVAGSPHSDISSHQDRHTLEAPITYFYGGVKATDVLSTVIGCARTLPLEEALVVADGALSRQRKSSRVTRSALYEALTHLSHKGSAKARRVAQLMSDKSDSPGETLTRLRLHEFGLYPQEQYRVRTDAGEYFGDFGFEQQKVIIEFDGRVKQTSQVMNPDGWAIDREKERENALLRKGWRILRVNWHHVSSRNPVVLEQALRDFGLLH